MKTYLCNSCFVRDCPDEHRGSNGNNQFLVLIRAKSKKEVAKILKYSSVSFLNRMGCNVREDRALPEMEENVIYYRPEHTKSGYIDGWYKITGEKKSEKYE